MKPIYFLAVIICATAALSISSCDKEQLPSPVNNNSSNTTPNPYSIDLTAGAWLNVANGVYTCPLPNAIPASLANSGVIKVYLLLPDQKIQINFPVDFMGGKLSASASATNVSINYLRSDNRPLPFNYLNIRVVIG